jgi:magnesium-transporting ATPase (P-type)
MSVIVEDEDGVPTLFCKGADEVIFPLLAEDKLNDNKFIESTKENLNYFSEDGLRTLAVGYR